MNDLKLVVLISGRGSNLHAILQAIEAGRLNATVLKVLCNHADAPGLQYARQACIPFEVLNAAGWEAALDQQLQSLRPDLVVLAGFMKILSAAFVNRHYPRLINIHPSLLPLYPGLNTHRRALQAGDREHGASVHIVTAEVDAGPILLQGKVPVLPHDTEEQLAQRVLQMEHRIYPTALQWFAEGRISWSDHNPRLDGAPLPIIWSNSL